jgi:hypothetical protein
MQAITRHIVGYDPATEAVTVEYHIPSEMWQDVAALVKADDDDPDYVYNYPLGASDANEIIAMLGKRADRELSYFLECEAN